MILPGKVPKEEPPEPVAEEQPEAQNETEPEVNEESPPPEGMNLSNVDVFMITNESYISRGVNTVIFFVILEMIAAKALDMHMP